MTQTTQTTYNAAISKYPHVRVGYSQIAESVQPAVRAAIKHANWFPEMDNALRLLAAEGNADQIRAWANEIRADSPNDNEDDAYWRETADMFDAVADAIDAR